MFETKLLRGLMLAMVLALVVALLLPTLVLADKEDPPVNVLLAQTHDVGTINLSVDDDGGASGSYTMYWPCPPCTTEHSWPTTNFLVGNSAGNIADGEWNLDWSTVTAINIAEPGPMAHQFGSASYNDTGLGTPLLGLYVDQYSCAWNPPYDDFVLVAYNIRNYSGGPLTGLYAGHYVESDVDGAGGSDYTSYDAVRGLARQWESTWVGLMYLTEPPSTYQNHVWGSHPTNDGSAYSYLSAGTFDVQIGPADVGFTMGIGPFDLADGETMLLGSAWLAGSSEADLEANAAAAKEAWFDSGGCGACPVVVGEVLYTGAATGDVHIGAFSDLELDPDFGTVLQSPSGYVMPVCAPGDYYVCAFMDAAGNGPPPDEEIDPAGCHPVTVSVNWGEDNEGVDIILEGPEEEFVPELGSIALLGSGLVGLAGYATLRRRAKG